MMAMLDFLDNPTVLFHARQMEGNICLPGIEEFNHTLKLCIGCFGISVNVLVNIVIQMVQSVVVGYLVKKNKKLL
jgi:hypothetical protein